MFLASFVINFTKHPKLTKKKKKKKHFYIPNSS